MWLGLGHPVLFQPRVNAAAQGNNLLVAAAAQSVDGLSGADAAGAVDNGGIALADVWVFASEDAVKGQVR